MGTDDRRNDGDPSQSVDATFRLGSERAAAGAALEVVLVSEGTVTTIPLPDRTPVVVGRSNDADVRVANASLSRKHVALHTTDSGIEIEDLRSSNGTKLAGARLAPGHRRPLRFGDVVELGEVLLMVRPLRVQVLGGSPEPETRERIVGAAMKPIYEMIHRVAVGHISVLLRGETGVGKEVVARALHDASPRASKPFVTLNCAALPDALLENELFGHERGAFTGASATKQGLLETADGGTLLFDEIGELPLAMQAKILRVLEDKRVLRVGGTRDREIDVRFLAATHRDLEGDAAAGRFRADLLYRLNGVTILVPPLRDRIDEVVPLARAFMERARAQIGFPGVGVLGHDAIRALERHRWPGNVRELRNAIERAVLLAGGAAVERLHLPDVVRGDRVVAVPPLPPHIAASASAPTVRPPTALDSEQPTLEQHSGDLRSAVEEVERQQIAAALEDCAGNQTRAAKKLGISRRALVRKLEAYGLPRPRKRGK